jgi:hypothetical protein
VTDPSSSPSAPAPRGPGRPKLSKRGSIGLGLVLTLLGLFFLGTLVPPSPPELERALPVVGAGILALWVGGILLGRGARA